LADAVGGASTKTTVTIGAEGDAFERLAGVGGLRNNSFDSRTPNFT
jgi:hypothetical protein